MEKIYHYTREAGMNGICKNNELWVFKTSLSKNDNTDSLYVKKVLKELAQEIHSENLFFREALNVMQSVLNPVGDEMYEDYLVNNVYMFCVDEIENDDKMKIEFGPKKIIFCKERLINNFEQVKDNQNLYKEFKYGEVVYDTNKQKQMLLTIIEKVERMYLQYLGGNQHEDLFRPIIAATPINDISGNTFYLYLSNSRWKKRLEFEFEEAVQQGNMWTFLANEFYRTAPFIKNPEFEYEKEFRFAFYGTKTKSYDSPNKFVIPLTSGCVLEFIELDETSNKKM